MIVPGRLVVLSVALLVVCCSCGFGQLTQKEIFQLDVFVYEKGRDTPRRVAQHFISMGQEVQERLRNEKKRGPLDDESSHRLRLLEEALKPVNEFYDSMKSTANPAEPRLTNEESKDLLSDVEIGNRAFVAIGEEEAVTISVERCLANLKSTSKMARENAYSPINLVANKFIAELMDFTDQQIQDIEKITRKATESMRVGSLPEFEKMERLLASHWKHLLFELDQEQKEKAEELIGEPVQWFRNAGIQELKTITFDSGSFVVTSGGRAAKRPKLPEGRSIFDLTLEELDFHNLNVFSSVSFRMLMSPFVWDELELTPEQRKEIKLAVKSVDLASSSFDDAHLRELLNQELELPKLVKSVLTESQCTWFQQMELQIYTAKFATSIGLLHPRMAEALKLKRRQTDKIQVLANKFEREAESLALVIKEEREKIQQDFESEVKELLTDKQNSIFNKLTKVGKGVRAGQ